MDLEQMVQTCIDQGRYASAIFFADQLTTTKKGVWEFFLLARTYKLSGQHKRALHVLEREDIVKANPECFLLAAQCVVECEEWEYGLELLDFGETDLPKGDADIRAGLCFIKGRILEYLENRVDATVWYKVALSQSALCYEAFERLVEGHMLDGTEEARLLDDLTFAEGQEAVRDVYSCRLRKYSRSQTVQERVRPSVSPRALVEGVSHTRGRSGEGVTAAALGGDCGEERASLSLVSMAAHAELHYYHNEFEKCHALTKEILERDPYNRDHVLTVHVSVLVQLQRASDLFYAAHMLVDEHPDLAVSWYAVGCYYLLTHKLEEARSFFSKSTTIDPHYGPAWLGFGHAFAQEGEHDQAMAAYRTASRVLLGCHIPALCIGTELIKASNPNLAEKFIERAKDVCPYDPIVFHELGTLAYDNRDYTRAATLLEHALELYNSSIRHEAAEPTLVNLGHVYRKLGQFELSIMSFKSALRVAPKTASTYAALGFTHGLMGMHEKAIENYHKALGLDPDNTLADHLLGVTIEELAKQEFVHNV